MTGWKLLVVEPDGSTDYVRHEPTQEVAVFRTKREAEETRDFFEMGLDEDEVQSISVVRA